jgi:PTH1 family peptidyl-tRNA hydrolase
VLGKQIHLLLPTTYMNESGTAVRRYLNGYHLSSDHLVVVVDDVALPFGKLRLRPSGSSGGHNGLKSIQSHLGTDQYARLRVGIGGHENAYTMADYVLDTFSQNESSQLPPILTSCCRVIENLAAENLHHVMNQVNSSDGE